MEIGKRIKELREYLGLSQREFAEILGIHPLSISRYESGKSNPAPSVLKLIEDKFSVNPEWLLEGKGEMFLTPPPSEASKTELFGQIIGSNLDAVMEELAHKVLAEVMTERGIVHRKEVVLYDKLHHLAKEKLKSHYQEVKVEIGFHFDLLDPLWSSTNCKPGKGESKDKP